MKRRAVPRKPVLMSGAIEFAGGTIMPRDGGELERHETAKYRAWAKAISYEYPPYGQGAG
jgi:hypothetical protein